MASWAREDSFGARFDCHTFYLVEGGLFRCQESPDPFHSENLYGSGFAKFTVGLDYAGVGGKDGFFEFWRGRWGERERFFVIVFLYFYPERKDYFLFGRLEGIETSS
jgi:hypothetical protein